MQHRHPIFLLPDLRAEFRQFLRHGRYAVTLLDAQAVGSCEHAAAAPRRRSEQYGPQIGAGGDVQHRAGTFQPVQHIAAHPVALQAVRAQAGDGDAVSQRQQERRVGPVALHRRAAAGVPLAAGDREQVRLPLLHPDAEGGHDVQRDVDIGAALHRRQDTQGAAARQQGERQQQSGDELAAHIAPEGVVPRRQPPGKRDGVPLPGHRYALLRQNRLIDAHAPLHEPGRAGKHGAAAGQQCRRDAESQGAAAFAAGIRPAGADMSAGAGDAGRIALQTARAAHGADAVHGGQHVLTGGDALDDALALCQCAAQEHPVGAALGRRRCRRARRPSGIDGHGHDSAAPFSRMSTASR